MSLPGYGTLPFVTSSVSRIPKDHTSDFIVNLPYNAASGAVHLMGNFAPNEKRNELITIETGSKDRITRDHCVLQQGLVDRAAGQR